MGKKYFIVSDVHSFLKPLMNALSQNGFEYSNKNHILIVLGDLFDRGNDSFELFSFVKNLHKQERFIYIRGNHEDLLFDCMNEIDKGYTPSRHHFHNGTVKTICQFCNENEWVMYTPEWIKTKKAYDTMKPILDFIENNSFNYVEIKDYILVHGWVPCDFKDSVTPFKKEITLNSEWFKADNLKWQEAHWINGMNAWLNGARIPNKTIVCGHFHCSWGWSHIRQKYKEFPPSTHKDFQKSFQPFVDDGIIAIDSCTAYTGKVNCLVLE